MTAAAASMAAVPEELQAKLDAEVTQELDRAMATLVDPDYVARELFLEPPVTEPIKKLEILMEHIEHAIDREAFNKFPDSEIAKFGRKAEELFPLLSRGDEIEVTFREDGRTIKGFVVELDEKVVKINNLPIRIEDLTDASQAYFDKRNATLKRQTYIRARTAELKDQRAQYRDSLRDSRRREVLNEEGYICINGVWQSRLSYLNEALTERRKKLYGQLEPLAIFKVYYANGLVHFREQWMTADEAAEIKRLLEEAAKAQQQATQGQDALPAGTDGGAAAGDQKPPEPAPVKPNDAEIWD